MAYELIETIEVGSGGAASIEFTSIPQDGVDLLLVVSSRCSDANTKLTVNSNTGSVYDFVSFYNNNNSVSNTTNGINTFDYSLFHNTTSTTANTFSSLNYYFSNYASSVNKSFSADGVTENNASNLSFTTLAAGSIADTNGITSVKFEGFSGGTIQQYSTASLYKIY